MITASEIWDMTIRKMPRGRWILLEEIYELIENEASLDFVRQQAIRDNNLRGS